MRKLTLLLTIVLLFALAMPAWAFKTPFDVPYDPNYTSPSWHEEFVGDDTKDGYMADMLREKEELGMTWEEYYEYSDKQNQKEMQKLKEFAEKYGYTVDVCVNVWGRYQMNSNYEPEIWYKLPDALVNFPDLKPFVSNKTGRTMIPIRFVAEKLGAEEVDYGIENGTLHVWIVKDGTRIDIYAGQNKALVNGEEVYLDAPVELIKNRTVVPLRFVSEALGCNVYWMDVLPNGASSKGIAPFYKRKETVIIDDPDGGLEKAIQATRESRILGEKSKQILLEILEKAKRGEKVYPVEPASHYFPSKKEQPPAKTGGLQLVELVKGKPVISGTVVLMLAALGVLIWRRYKYY